MNKGTEELIASMKAAAEKATPGEWYSDHIDTDGTYGNGDDCREGWKAAGVYSERGDLLLDSSNSDVAIIREEYDEDGFIAFDETGFKNAEFVVACRPENVLALIAALEQAQQQLTDSNRFRDAWKRLAKQNIREREKEIDEHLAALDRIAGLEARTLTVKLPNFNRPVRWGGAEISVNLSPLKAECIESIRTACSAVGIALDTGE
ncbi:ead/Ea22-like family protein [Dryocola sp. LX212]